MYFSNKVYDILTWIAKILLPALATLYVALSTVWSLPYGDQVSQTLMAFVLFLGVLLNLSNSQYLKIKSDVSHKTLSIQDMSYDQLVRLKQTIDNIAEDECPEDRKPII
jgi:hypothetical protein